MSILIRKNHLMKTRVGLCRHLLLATLVYLVALPASANDIIEDIEVSGFLSFGGGITDAQAFPGGEDPSDPEDLPNPDERTPKYSSGSGRFLLDDALRFDQNTRLGLQLDVQLGNETSATIQVVSKGAIDNYAPDVSWAYLSHAFTPDTHLRAGRFRVPLYLVSDYLDIGVAYPWISPPVELYSTINLSNITGIDLLYSKQIGAAIWSVQPFLGASDLERGDFTAEHTELYGIASAISFHAFTLRAAYMQYEFHAKPWPLNEQHASLIDNLNLAGATEIIDDLDPNGTTNRFLTIGLNWAYKNWEFQSEWARRRGDEVVPDVDGLYATLSYQWKSWKPHITYANRKQRNSTANFESRLAQLNVISPPLAGAVESFFHTTLRSEDNDSESITLGLNYHFDASKIGKIEISEVHNKTSTGLFDFATKDDKNHIFNFVIDVVF